MQVRITLLLPVYELLAFFPNDFCNVLFINGFSISPERSSPILAQPQFFSGGLGRSSPGHTGQDPVATPVLELCSCKSIYSTTVQLITQIDVMQNSRLHHNFFSSVFSIFSLFIIF